MYSFQSRVKYSEVDKDGFLSLEGMMNYFQDCSALHSEDLGVGIEFQKSNDITWMIITWHVQIFRKPKFSEKITIGTWPYSFKSIKGGRHYVLLDDEGNTLARANSEWVLINTKENKITKIPNEVRDAYTIEDELDMGEIRKKIAIGDTLESYDKILVTPFFLDTNGHVNNVKYLSVAEGYMDADYNEFRVEYKNQAFLHDEIFVYKGNGTQNSQIVLKNQKDEILVNIEFGKME